MVPWKTARPEKVYIGNALPPRVVSLVNTNDWRKYEKLEMSKKENVTHVQADSVGRVRLRLILRDFSDLQPREVIMILAILFGKSRSRLLKKSVVTYLKQIVNKARELLFYRN